MSDYGPDYGRPGPPGPPPGAPGGSASPGGPSASARQSSSGDPAQLVMITNYVAAGLGVLAFVWGFLNWFKNGSTGVAGYSIAGAGAGAVIGLSLAAGLIAAATTLEKKSGTLVPAALALAAFLVAVGIIIDKGSIGQGDAMVGTGIGLILALVTTILQTLALAYGWALSAGRIAAPQSQPKAQQNPWGGPSQGQPQGGYGPPPSYRPGGQQPGGQQSGGQQSGGQQYPPAPPSYQYGGQYDSPTQSQPVQGQPQQPQQGNPYGPPGGPSQGQPQSQPQGQPQGNPYGPPPGAPQSQPPGQPQSGQPQGNPYGSPSPERSSESSAGYGEATRHIPRFPAPSESPDPDGPPQSGPSSYGP